MVNLIGRPFFGLCLNSTSQVVEMSNVLDFWMECRDFSINVPDFKKLSDEPFSDLGLFHIQGLFDKEQKYVLSVLPQNPIPNLERDFQDYLDLLLTILPKNGYILHEYIKGQTFTANVICKEGSILLLQVRKKFSD